MELVLYSVLQLKLKDQILGLIRCFQSVFQEGGHEAPPPSPQ